MLQKAYASGLNGRTTFPLLSFTASQQTHVKVFPSITSVYNVPLR